MTEELIDWEEVTENPEVNYTDFELYRLEIDTAED